MKSTQHHVPWNMGRLARQKPPLKPKGIWATRIPLQNARQIRDLGISQPCD